MRVLMTADTVGGVWTYALDLCRSLAPYNVEVLLATMGEPLCEAQWAEARRVPNVKVRESQYKLEWMPDPWDDVDRAGQWLLGLEQEFGPDVVHLNGYAHGVLPFSAPTVVVGHSCVLSWWQAVKGVTAPAEWDCYARKVRDGLRRSSAVVAPTRAMLSELERWYGPFPGVPAHVIPNGRADALYRGGATQEKEAFILSAGRFWDEAKNLSLLVEAAPELHWPVHAAGDAGDSARNDAIHFLGRLTPEELAGHLKRAAVYALPARYEPFGLSVLEAALSGCALVLSDIDSLRENWDGAALFVPTDDAGALRDALNALAEDDHLRQRLALRAQMRAASVAFQPWRMAATYRDLYRELSGETAPTVTQQEAVPQCAS